MSNIFIGWKESADPPAPWTRLTRQGKYIRLTDTAAYHLVVTGSTTHNHNNNMTYFIVGTCNGYATSNNMGNTAMGMHGHTNPSSYSISSANNDPAYYGLDLIYMDFATWKAYQRKFPDGAVVLSSQALSSDATLSRFSDADGKYIVNTTPATTGGSTGSRSHSVSASTGRDSISVGGNSGTILSYVINHGHTISLTSSGNTNEPRTLSTRFYEILSTYIAARAGMVAFCDGIPDADWEILSSWKDANLKSDDVDPTLSGSDTHSETVSGNTSGADDGGNTRQTGSDATGVQVTHVHPVSGTLESVSHVPSSILLMPIKLNVTYSLSKPRSQIIGLAW